MKVSFVTTVYNEELTINDLLVSLFTQSRIPDEIIIVDGGSTDRTLSVISNFQFPISKNKVKVISKKGNRSVGRNEAIRKSSNEIIVCSDAGNTLDKDWVKNITKPFEEPEVDVVAGYYKGDVKSIFQKCLIPYVLVMPDKTNKNNFLPATRSMAFRKYIWEKAGKFSEEFSNNEDYVFAKKLKKIDANILFEKKAIVYWQPRENLRDAFTMFYRFAKGDSEAKIFRPKVLLIFLRYAIFSSLFILSLILQSYFILNTLYLTIFLYILWSILKNYMYINDARAIFYLPLMQIVSDIAVVSGTISGTVLRRYTL